MATIKMFKGNVIADIYDSPETIAQAKKDGYLPVDDEKKPEPKDFADHDGDGKNQARPKRQ